MTSQQSKTENPKLKYVESVGRRKTSTARVRIYPSTSKPIKDSSTPLLPKEFDVVVNDKPIQKYFSSQKNIDNALKPFKALSVTFKTSAKVEGGGITSQAEAIRLGIARVLSLQNDKWKPRLKSLHLLTRDPRAVERKKPGLRKARRPQQWRKR